MENCNTRQVCLQRLAFATAFGWWDEFFVVSLGAARLSAVARSSNYGVATSPICSVAPEQRDLFFEMNDLALGRHALVYQPLNQLLERDSIVLEDFGVGNHATDSTELGYEIRWASPDADGCP